MLAFCAVTEIDRSLAESRLLPFVAIVRGILSRLLEYKREIGSVNRKDGNRMAVLYLLDDLEVSVVMMRIFVNKIAILRMIELKYSFHVRARWLAFAIKSNNNHPTSGIGDGNDVL